MCPVLTHIHLCLRLTPPQQLLAMERAVLSSLYPNDIHPWLACRVCVCGRGYSL